MQNLQNNPDLMLLDLQTTRLIYKFLHTVNKKQTAWLKKDSIIKKRHFVENKTEIMKNILKI